MRLPRHSFLYLLFFILLLVTAFEAGCYFWLVKKKSSTNKQPKIEASIIVPSTLPTPTMSAEYLKRIKKDILLGKIEKIEGRNLSLTEAWVFDENIINSKVILTLPEDALIFSIKAEKTIDSSDGSPLFRSSANAVSIKAEYKDLQVGDYLACHQMTKKADDQFSARMITKFLLSK